jgi:hypothetical protein
MSISQEALVPQVFSLSARLTIGVHSMSSRLIDVG